MSASHEAAHTGPIKNPQQLLMTVIFAFVLPVFAIIGLVYFVASGERPDDGGMDPELAIARRLQKVGMVEIGEAADPNRPLRTGEEVYNAQCSACHATGTAGAPLFGNAEAWAPRLPSGFAALVESSLKGKGAMAPQGGGEFNDIEIARGVAYMANAGGGNFEEPADPREAEGDAEGAGEEGAAAEQGQETEADGG